MENIKERSLLLSIKECDLREDALFQCRTSVDKGIHIGGAYSAVPPMTALYYGGCMNYDVENSASPDQDIFLLSKGHAVAALAAVYADVGYFDRKYLENSRGYGALIKGHPGPTIPGVPVSTGPLGHGISLAAGYALKRKETNDRNVFCLVGDGELQEGSCWEGIMYAAEKRLNNLCIIVDKNNGQSDNTKQLLVSMEGIPGQFEAFGYQVAEAYSEDMTTMLSALERFVSCPRAEGPTVIICHSRKGLGGYSSVTDAHKASLDDSAIDNEIKMLHRKRRNYMNCLSGFSTEIVNLTASQIGYQCVYDSQGLLAELNRTSRSTKVKCPDIRVKELVYKESELPKLDSAKEYAANEIIKNAMKVFAGDDKLYTVDSDLSNASGLYDGTSRTNSPHALNVGIAECNMMCIAEALASEGSNVWVSTFAPFFDWQAFRRIAVSYQERAEVMQTGEGWLNEGHNLDITFVATAANLDTAVNGATHMGNDDNCFFDQLAHVNIIDISCPQLLLSVLKWVAEGNRGLNYIRLMRNKSRVLYPEDFKFEYGKGYFLRDSDSSKAVIVTAAHGTSEALAAAEILEKEGIEISVIDMPSFDPQLLTALLKRQIPIYIAEQNNGYIFNKFSRYVMQQKISADTSLIHYRNTLTQGNELQFIQSGTYHELIRHLFLDSESIAGDLIRIIKKEERACKEEH